MNTDSDILKKIPYDMLRHHRGDTCDIATVILAHDESPNFIRLNCPRRIKIILFVGNRPRRIKKIYSSGIWCVSVCV